MDEAKAWLEIEKILSDTDGKYWDNIRGRLQKPVDVLSKNLSLEKFKIYIQKISDCKSNERNIISIEQINIGAGCNSSNEKNQQILRMSCLKSASTIFSDLDVEPKEKVLLPVGIESNRP